MCKCLMQLGAVSAILISAFGLLLYGHTKSGMGEEKAAIQECVLCMTQKDGSEGISLRTTLQENVPLWINGWEQEGQWWLFLPAMFREQEVLAGDETVVLEEGELYFTAEDGETREIQVLFGSDIPFAWMDTESGNLEFLQESKENREEGSLYFVGADRTLEYAGHLPKVKIRGNATRLQPKSPFRFRLEEKTSLAGLGASKDYVLLAEYGDISLMRNKAAMELANRTTDLYEPDGEHMDLYVNGDYMGVYLLCEGISIGENRLEIADLEQETDFQNARELEDYGTFAEVSGEDTAAKGFEIPQNPEDITGGYLLELEYHGRYEGEETTGFRTGQDWSLVIKEPDHASREQVMYIRDQFQRAEDAMYAPDWKNPDTGQPLEELVDLQSFVHKYLVDEICMNTDPWTSQFLYKDKGDDVFHFGPMWDYDMAFGHYDVGFSPEEFYGNWHIWYSDVYDYPKFQEILKEEYDSSYLPVLKELADTKLSEWEESIEASARMNFTRWNIEEIYNRNSITYTGGTFGECVDALRDYIRKRTEFLSSQWLENP